VYLGIALDGVGLALPPPSIFDLLLGEVAEVVVAAMVEEEEVLSSPDAFVPEPAAAMLVKAGDRVLLLSIEAEVVEESFNSLRKRRRIELHTDQTDTIIDSIIKRRGLMETTECCGQTQME